MTSQLIGLPPLSAAVEHALADLAQVRGTDAVTLSPAACGALLLRLSTLTGAVEELRARVIVAAQAAGGVPTESGPREVSSWLAEETHCGRPAAREVVRRAESLAGRPVLVSALRSGRVSSAHVPVICTALDRLPESMSPEIVERAEAYLVECAERFDPRQLRVLGRTVLEVVAPEVCEEDEARFLLAEEARARDMCWLSLHRSGDGTTTIRGILPDLAATRLANYLHAFTAPRHRGVASRHDSRPVAGDGIDPADGRVWWKLPHRRRLGEALCELLEAIDPARLPEHGGASTRLVVTMSLEALRTEVAAATVLGPDGAERISAGEARRLACSALIIPAVLGGTSEVLDLGRSQRLGSRAQRTALMLAHPTCQRVGCEKPGAWCEVHHLDPWSRGGRSDLQRLALLCAACHHLIHDPGMDHTRFADGSVRFHRRP